MALPQLTDEQRKDALAKAAAARRERAQRMAELKSGQISLADLFREAQDNTDGPIAKTKVGQVVKNLPGFGPKRVEAFFAEAGIDGDKKRVKGLTEKQRALVLELADKYRR